MLVEKMELEDLVNSVQYGKLLDGYVPSKFALDFVTFIKLVNDGRGEQNLTPIIHYDMLDQVISSTNNLFVAFRGSAKALDVGTLIMTPSGSVRMGDLVVGDKVIDRNGEVTEVTHVSGEFRNDAYRITLDDGSSFIANEDHLHIVEKLRDNGDKQIWSERVVDTKYLVKQYERKSERGLNRYAIPLISSPVAYKQTDVGIDAYLLGALACRGVYDEKEGTVAVKITKERWNKLNGRVRFKHHIKTFTGVKTVHVQVSVGREWLDEDRLFSDEILYGSIADRLDYIRGVCDFGFNTLSGRIVNVVTTNERLASSIRHIVNSLGGKCVVNDRNNDYVVSIWLGGMSPFTAPTYVDIWWNGKVGRKPRFVIKNIEKVDGVISKCISVSSESKSYLIEGSIVTHNTSIIHEYMTLYIATYGGLPVKGFENIEVGMYIADTIDNGVKSMRKNLQYRWEKSEFLQKFVPKANITDTRWEFINADGHHYCVRGFGASSGVRGFKEYGKRPTIAGLDDLLSDKNAQSPTIVSDITDVIYKATRQAMHPKHRMINWTGTPFNKKDPIYVAAGSSGWNTKVYPICEKFPCTKKEFVGAWEDRFGYEDVKREYNLLMSSGQVQAFNQELMLRIISDEDRLVDKEDIVWYSRDTVLENKGRYNFYITTDFAVSETQKSDYSVIIVWAYTNNGDWLLVDGVCNRQLMDKNVNDLFRFVLMYRPQAVGIELSGQQKGFVSWIKQEMLKKNIFFTIASDKSGKEEGFRPTTNKLVRFNGVVPLFKQKKIWFPNELKDTVLVQEAVDEITYATKSGFKSKNDDIADNISQLVLFDAWKPSEEEWTDVDPDDVYNMRKNEENNSGISSYII